MAFTSRDFVHRHPVATKPALRALLKAAERGYANNRHGVEAARITSTFNRPPSAT